MKNPIRSVAAFLVCLAIFSWGYYFGGKLVPPKQIVHRVAVIKYRYVPPAVLINVCKAEDEVIFRELWRERGRLP